MKIVVGVLVGLLVAGSLVADFLWRRWMAARRAERESFPDRNE